MCSNSTDYEWKCGIECIFDKLWIGWGSVREITVLGVVH